MDTPLDSPITDDTPPLQVITVAYGAYAWEVRWPTMPIEQLVELIQSHRAAPTQNTAGALAAGTDRPVALTRAWHRSLVANAAESPDETPVWSHGANGRRYLNPHSTWTPYVLAAVVQLHVVHGWAVKALARLVGTTPSTIRQWLARADVGVDRHVAR